MFFFDLCCPILEYTNVMCEHHYLLLYTLFLTFYANANADIM